MAKEKRKYTKYKVEIEKPVEATKTGKYDEKLAVDISFEDLIKLTVTDEKFKEDKLRKN